MPQFPDPYLTPAVLRCRRPGPHSVHISYVVARNDASRAPIVVPFHMCVLLMNYQQNIYMNKKNVSKARDDTSQAPVVIPFHLASQSLVLTPLLRSLPPFCPVLS